MARGEKSVAAATFLLLLGLSALVNEAKAENLFPTYEDDLQDQARVGVISVKLKTWNLIMVSIQDNYTSLMTRLKDCHVDGMLSSLTVPLFLHDCS